jgi:Predicted carbamoyl transferase, NodU family
MYILGINAYHGDSAACLIKDGELVSAAEEERFRRVKHWAGFPLKSIEYCLNNSGISLSDVDHIAINQDPYANFSKKLSYLFKNKINLNLLVSRVKNKSKRLNLSQQLHENIELGKFKGKFHKVEHHMAHLSSAFHVSPI